MIMMALPRCGAWYNGKISIKQVSLNDVRRHIFAANYIRNNRRYWTFWKYHTTNIIILTIEQSIKFINRICDVKVGNLIMQISFSVRI